MATDFRDLPDLALRPLGAGVVWANDAAFAGPQNLLLPGRPGFDATAFGQQGKVYDGWETRRRRQPGHDEAVVRLGVSGVVRGVVVDTTWFRGNYPPFASVEAVHLPDYPSADELRQAEWVPLVPRSPLRGDTENLFPVTDERCWTHVRLCIYPDGGVARLRVHGEPLPDPRFLDGDGVDLAAVENGGRVVACSDGFFGPPGNLICPGVARSMAEGWETARRRDDGNDWVVVRLAGAGTVRIAELDTSYFLGNSPGWASLRGWVGADGGPGDGRDQCELLPRTRLQPDTRHRFLLPAGPEVTHVRLDIYPDGGMARLRLVGALAPHAREWALRRWAGALPGTPGCEGGTA